MPAIRPLALSTCLLCTSAFAADLYVAPSGKDDNPGTSAAPLASLDGARLKARKLAGKEKVTVHFAKGVYYLPATVRFTAEDSGAEGKPVIYEGEEGAVISGGSLLKLDWQPDGSRFKAVTPAGLEMDQLWINGRREPMARFPNREEGKNLFDAWVLEHTSTPDPEKDPLKPERIAKWSNPAGAYVHAMHTSLWGDMHWLVKGKKADGKLDLEGGWQNNRPSGMHPRYRMVENVFEELDATGEWFHDRTSNTLYYQPPAGTDLKTATVEGVRLPRLLSFEGAQGKAVKFIGLRGLTFRHAARTFMANKEQLLRTDWTVCRDGAVFIEGAENCAVESCTFDQVGGNTIFVNDYNRRITIRGCYIHDSGANGIAFVGSPEAVRNPIFRYGPQDYAKIDRTPGPKNDRYPADCLVEDCLITRTGRDEKQTAPVEIDIAARITVRHCSLYDVPRAGLNIGDGCFGGHVVEDCDIFNTVLETGDHGSFNSWGRDRFWDPSIDKFSQEVVKDPNLPFLDVIEPITLRHNRWRCDHGWDIDLDDGSTRYVIENNLLLNGGLKMREGYKRIARNNVIVNNALHPHCWPVNNGDLFTGNIVAAAYKPAAIHNGKWGETVDKNLFTTSDGDRTKYAKNGCDANSIVGDAQFIDPAKGDFRVKNGSPAFKIGFKNFPMDNFGVTSTKLKAIAKTPEIPGLKNSTATSAENSQVVWMGARLRNISGEEFSAYGVSKESGGVAIAEIHLAPSTPATVSGFKTGDLIQSVDGKAVPNLAAFKAALAKLPAKPETPFGIIRNQAPSTITVKGKVEQAK